MSIIFLKPPDDRIVVWGQSCSGKTTFSLQLDNHYYCFDALFKWHIIETLCLSTDRCLLNAVDQIKHEKFVLDGWHLSDKTGKLLPNNVSCYLIYAEYEQIISQYRALVVTKDQYWLMFKEWYCFVNYENLPGIRYFFNNGDNFIETEQNSFNEFVSRINV